MSRRFCCALVPVIVFVDAVVCYVLFNSWGLGFWVVWSLGVLFVFFVSGFLGVLVFGPKHPDTKKHKHQKNHNTTELMHNTQKKNHNKNHNVSKLG